MRKTIIVSLLVLAAISFGYLTINAQGAGTAETTSSKIEWMTIEEAIAANEEAPKKLFIDVYTDWCHWCKVMDKKTFTDGEVIDYLNENFYPVKFNAEQKEPITFKGKTYEYTPAGRRGVHLLAYALLNKQASYPSFVVLDEELNGVTILKGFQDKQKFLGNLKRATAAR